MFDSLQTQRNKLTIDLKKYQHDYLFERYYNIKSMQIKPNSIKLKMERETTEISPLEFMAWVCDYYFDGEEDITFEIPDEFDLIEDKIDSADAEDGGAYHTIIFQRKSDGKFFQGGYYDWDIENFECDSNGNVNRNDFCCALTEVFPEKQTITVYN